jgi:hypothetical protein
VVGGDRGAQERMSGMDTLVEFLLARLAEDEQAAQALHGVRLEAYEEGGDDGWAVEADPGGDPGAIIGDERLAKHIARHDPGRVLAEIDAKRRIVDMHSGHHECVSWDRHSTDLTPTDHTDTVLVDRGYTHEDDPTLRLLALPYAAHKDYRAEWAP